MCVVFWISPSPSQASTSPYSFIIVANRDEYLSRPTKDASWHDFEDLSSSAESTPSESQSPLLVDAFHASTPVAATSNDDDVGHFLCGRDLADPSFGTWLGISRNGRIGVLTNVHQFAKDDSQSVGEADRHGIRPETKVHETHPPQHGTGNDTPPQGPLAAPNLETLATKVKRTGPMVSNTTSTDPPVNTFSRGKLIKEYLGQSYEANKAGGKSLEETFLSEVSNNGSSYNGFNLALFDVSASSSPEGVKGYYYSNRLPAMVSVNDTFAMSDGTMRNGGMSNTVLGEPWEKVTRGNRELEEAINELSVFHDEEVKEETVVERLMTLMGQTRPVTSRADLPTTICVPLCEIPVPGAHLTPDHVAHGDHTFSTISPSRPDTPTHSAAVAYHAAERPYGTRLTTVILVKRNGEVSFVERDRLRLILKEDGMGVVLGGKKDRSFRFMIKA